jgi:hypothetical protein
MSTGSGVPVPPRARAVIQGFLVLDDIHGCGVACACGVEVGRGVAPAAAVAAVVAAIVAAVREGTGIEPGRLAAVAVGHKRASPLQDM